MKQSFGNRFGDFMAEKGFYIVLFLCVAAIGISGYYLVSTLSAPQPEQPVSGYVSVTVTPAPEHSVPPARPAVTAPPTPVMPSTAPPAATPKPALTAAASPAPTAAPEPTPQPDTLPSFFTWPLKGETIHPYSVETLAYSETMGDWRTHDGVDLAASPGTPVMATANGTVSAVEQDDLMGTTVTITHGGGMVSVYANLMAQPQVEVGDAVRAGDVIASVGETAIAESAQAAHLHFSMYLDGQPVDPAGYMPEV